MEIRYRVWDGEKMYYPQEEDATFTVSQVGIVSLGSEVGLPDLPTEYVAMLSTGIKDAEGKEIFDGDILSIKNSDEGDYGKVERTGAEFAVKVKPREDTPEKDCQIYLRLSSGEYGSVERFSLTVVGNVKENKWG